MAEYLGEKLAAFFGITTPKYQYVIDEYYRLKQQVSATSLKILKSCPLALSDPELMSMYYPVIFFKLFKVVPLFESVLVD